jgi:alpha-D-xyloside xylohydrolase
MPSLPPPALPLFPLSLLLLALAVPAPLRAAEPERLPDGIVVAVGDAFVKLEVRADNAIRVAYARDRAFFARPSLMLDAPRPAPPAWSLKEANAMIAVSTARVEARVDRATGAVSFFDAAGQPILAERPAGRTFEPAEVQGEKTLHVRQEWEPAADESLHGLGQEQFGIVDLKGYDLDLWQRNTVVVVPFLVSSRGYGILWDNNSFTRFGDLRPFEAIPADCLRDAAGQPGGLTRSRLAPPGQPDAAPDSVATADLALPGRQDRSRRGASFRWSGTLVPPTTGDYQFQTYSNGGIKVWIDGRLVIDHWRQDWLTEYDQVKLHLAAGRTCALAIEAGGEQATTMQLRWKTPAPANAPTALWSEVGDGIDYTFVYGPQLDQVIAGYRRLTGRATLLPRWAFGLWQSRQRYETAQQSLDVVDEYRRRGVPFDNIVQDWMYWRENSWGSHQFDATRFPDPDAWIKALHERHAHLMISVWGKFYSGEYAGNENFQAMQQAGFLYQPTLTEGIHDWVGRGTYNFTFYDAFNPGARRLFWAQINTALFRRGVDAWWMDATEPDVVQPSPTTLAKTQHFMGRTALGPAARVLNAYSLENSRAVYEGQRAAAPDQRVFILTRSGFAGIQRYATTTWSGDVTSTWTALAKQIPAGLGYSLSGVPYWTTDSGGYTMPARFSAKSPKPEDAEEWRELNARWFQFATFCPVTRLHGELQPREPWTFGGDTHPAYQTIVKFDRLRYRMLPYIYSLAGAATLDAGTFMRPLVMDFPRDAKARTIADQYLFGPALLVAPVTTYQARQRPVYLPATPGGWFDFWTGAATAGGQTIDAPAPYDALPLFVRAGAIVPFGPELQYTGEKPADPITLYVYAGADGTFTLYEDDGLTYGYERGEFARIPLRWDNTRHTLTIGKREGAFPGMLAGRTFEIVLVTPDRPVGFSFTPKADRTIPYRGEPIETHLP